MLAHVGELLPLTTIECIFKGVSYEPHTGVTTTDDHFKSNEERTFDVFICVLHHLSGSFEQQLRLT